MTWSEAVTAARTGKAVRRSGWVDRWVTFSQYLWWLTPFNPVTGLSGTPHVVQVGDWTPSEFDADDWTTDAIAVMDALELVRQSLVNVVVPATACPLFVYAPAGAVFSLDAVDSCRPISIRVPSWAASVVITASGLWSRDGSTFPGTSFNPQDGSGIIGSDAGYISATINSDLLTPITCSLDTLVGLFDLPGRNGVELFIGGSGTLAVPASAQNLVLGFHDQTQWNNNAGSVAAKVVWYPPST